MAVETCYWVWKTNRRARALIGLFSLKESHLLKLIPAVWAETVLQAILLEAVLHLRVT